MISTLTITSLNQGKLYGDKPTIDQLEANGAILHDESVTVPVSKLRRLLAWERLDWSAFVTSFGSKVRG